MSHRQIFIGAFAVLGLLFIWPPLAALVLAVMIVVAVVTWLTDSGRPCPRCGEKVPTGTLDCEHCGFDFRTIGAD